LRVVLLGPPGAGKGTQAKQLAHVAGVPHVASGDLLRLHQEEGTELGRIAKGYMEKGELVPDEVVIRMVLERIHGPDAEDGYILDGFPRTVAQAKALDEALGKDGATIDLVPLMEVEQAELVRRLAGRWLCSRCQTPYHEEMAPPAQPGVCDTCGEPLYQRPDDRAEAVSRRLAVYQEQTAPLVEYYQRQGQLRKVNGQQEIDKVAADLLEAVRG